MTPELAAVLADVVLVVHALIAGFVVVGLLLTVIGGWRGWSWVRNFWFRAVHLALVVVVVAESVFGISCPLTVWEVQLRTLAGQQDADDLRQVGFLAYYVRRILFFPVHWEWSDEFLTGVYLAFGAGVLATWMFFPPRWPRFRRRSANSTEPELLGKTR